MKSLAFTGAVVVLFGAGSALAVAEWGQCGGNGYTGSTQCDAGLTCVYQNDWYSQCLKGSGSGTTTKATTTTTTKATTTTTTKATTSTSAPAGSPTLYLAGDSTTAGGPNDGGWGGRVYKYLSVPVVNKAVPGKSSRSFTTQGYFQGMYNLVKSGDIVVIEFGHNEGGGPAGNPQQGVCPGTSLTATCLDTDGKTVVYTYFKYMTDAINTFKSKGAKVIVASQTPNNPYVDSSTPIYVSYAQQVAQQTGVSFVDHFKYLLTEYKALGASTTNSLFISGDKVHTNYNGGGYSAQAFVRGTLCSSGNPLIPYVTDKNVVPASC